MDRFDDIWRNKFQQEDPIPDKWNTPSDNTWESVISRVRRSKRRKKVVPLFLFLFSMGFLATMVFIGQSSGSFSPEKDSVFSESTLVGAQVYVSDDRDLISENTTTEEKTTLLAQITEDKASIKTDNSSYEFFIEDSPAESLKELRVTRANSKQINYESSGVFEDYPLQTSNEGQIDRIDREKFLAEKFLLFPENNLDVKKFHELILQKVTKEMEEEPNAAISRTEFLDPYQLKHLETSIILNHQELNVFNTVKTNSKTSKQSWAFGFFLSPHLWQQKLSKSYTDILAPFDFNYSKTNFGLRIGIELSRELNESFVFYFQPGYSFLSGTSGHNSPILYSIINESQDNHSNSFVIDMATPFGFSGAEFQLIRKGEIPTQEIELNPVFRSEFNLHTLSIPTGIRYFPLKKSDFKPFFNAGIVFNQVIKLENSLISVLPNHDTFGSKITIENEDLSKHLKKNNWGFSLGVGSKINLSHGINLNISYQFSHSIGNINKSDINEIQIQNHELIFSATKKITKK